MLLIFSSYLKNITNQIKYQQFCQKISNKSVGLIINIKADFGDAVYSLINLRKIGRQYRLFIFASFNKAQGSGEGELYGYGYGYGYGQGSDARSEV